MSDDNVIEGVFGKDDDKVTGASEVCQILADQLKGEDEGVELLILMHADGQAAALMGNVDLDRAALLMMMGQVALTDTIMGGGDETVH